MQTNHPILLALCCALLSRQAAHSTTLSNNLSNAVAGTEDVSGQTWVATSFGTDASGYALSSITLLMSAAPSSSVTLQLYSNNLSQPGRALLRLTEASSLSPMLSPVTFDGAGYMLSSNTTYWAVLQATAGSAQWAYTVNSTGTGVGFQHTWAVTDDAGTDWLAFDSYPMLSGVSATPVSPAIVPEPTPGVSILLGFGTLLIGVGIEAKNRRTKYLKGIECAGCSPSWRA